MSVILAFPGNISSFKIFANGSKVMGKCLIIHFYKIVISYFEKSLQILKAIVVRRHFQTLIRSNNITPNLLWTNKKVIHGYSFISASWPPTIFVPDFFTPHLQPIKYHMKNFYLLKIKFQHGFQVAKQTIGHTG